jgi:uncharacterized protein YbjT (DUF2867 family)
MILITTPTGHIGSQLLAHLVQTDERLRVIARDPSKLSDKIRERVEVFQGAHDDPELLKKALTGVDQLFFVIPPSSSFSNADRYYMEFAKPVCNAIDEQKVKRVVYISGTGLGFDKNAGAVYSSSLVEKMIEATSAATRVVHAGTFMENLMHALGTIKAKGEIYNIVPPDTQYCWVATQDIAEASAKLLLDKTWSGKGSLGVLGPEDISYNDIAAIMTVKLGRTIKYVQTPADMLKKTYTQYGASDAAAQSLVDIHEAVGRGTFNRIKRSKENSTATSFPEWFDANMRSLIQG